MHVRNSLYMVIAATLTACGGGGGGSDDSGGNPAPQPIPQSASGAWVGTLEQGSSIINDLYCLAAETGDLACMFFDPSNGNFAGGAWGTIQVNGGNQVSGSGTSYAAQGYQLADGSSVAAFSITGGTVSEGNTLELTTNSAGAAGSISATYDQLYDRGSSLANVAASYGSFSFDGQPASFSVDSQGELFSQTQSGCIANGQVSIIDGQFNAYGIDVEISNCGVVDGTYQGLGITADFAATNDQFIFGVFSSTVGIFGTPVK
jgi:hypothetical protein